MKPYVFAIAALTCAVAACGTDEAPQYQEVCVKTASETRAPDSECHQKDPSVVYRYLPMTSYDDGSWATYVAAVGRQVYGLVPTPSDGTVVHDVPPAAGSWVAKDGTGRASFTSTPPPRWVQPPSPGSRPDPTPASTGGQLRPSYIRPSGPPPSAGLRNPNVAPKPVQPQIRPYVPPPPAPPQIRK